MRKYITLISLFFIINLTFAQHVGIVRKNYFSSYFDSTIMMNVDVLDSSTIRLGNVDPTSGVVTNIGNTEYNIAINLNGATLDPYNNLYYIGSGFNFLTIDIISGEILKNVSISGSLPSNAFQNFRFNTSDSKIYGMVPHNFYSTYYDSISMMNIEVLDSTQIRFASINPASGQYTIIGNSSYSNLYTLAGNSIDPFEMIYYYSAVDTLVGIDLYTGAEYSAVPIGLPSTAIFENIAYSCVDTSIYGITRRNYISSVYDSTLMTYIDVVDSTTFRLSKINPNTGAVTFVSPYNIGVGGNLTGGSFIDPDSLTYFLSNGNKIEGVSMVTGLVTSSVTKTFDSGAFALDMMRSTKNCFGSSFIRGNAQNGVNKIAKSTLALNVFPNPTQNEITLTIDATIQKIEILDARGSLMMESRERIINIASLASGIYFTKVTTENGLLLTSKFVKN